MLGGLLDLHELSVGRTSWSTAPRWRTINADLSAAGDRARGAGLALYAHAAMARQSTRTSSASCMPRICCAPSISVGGDAEKLKIAQISYEPWFVPDMTSLRDQLRAFLSKKTHFALVVDEYGEVEGLVTLEDILEEIVGEHQGRARSLGAGRCAGPAGRLRACGGLGADPRSQPSDGLATCPTRRPPPLPASSSTRPSSSPDAGQAFTFHGFRFQVLRQGPQPASPRWRITPARGVPPFAPRE